MKRRLGPMGAVDAQGSSRAGSLCNALCFLKIMTNTRTLVSWAVPGPLGAFARFSLERLSFLSRKLDLGINRYTLLCLKWITIKHLPESRVPSALCHVAAWMGGEFGGEWTHVHVWLSPFAVDMKWSIRHTSIQKKKLNFFFLKLDFLFLHLLP